MSLSRLPPSVVPPLCDGGPRRDGGKEEGGRKEKLGPVVGLGYQERRNGIAQGKRHKETREARRREHRHTYGLQPSNKPEVRLSDGGRGGGFGAGARGGAGWEVQRRCSTVAIWRVTGNHDHYHYYCCYYQYWTIYLCNDSRLSSGQTEGVGLFSQSAEYDPGERERYGCGQANEALSTFVIVIVISKAQTHQKGW